MLKKVKDIKKEPLIKIRRGKTYLKLWNSLTSMMMILKYKTKFSKLNKWEKPKMKSLKKYHKNSLMKPLDQSIPRFKNLLFNMSHKLRSVFLNLSNNDNNSVKIDRSISQHNYIIIKLDWVKSLAHMHS